MSSQLRYEVIAHDFASWYITSTPYSIVSAWRWCCVETGHEKAILLVPSFRPPLIIHFHSKSSLTNSFSLLLWLIFWHFSRTLNAIFFSLLQQNVYFLLKNIMLINASLTKLKREKKKGSKRQMVLFQPLL